MILSQLPNLKTFSRDGASKIAVAEGAHCRVTLWCLEPGQEIHPHAHAGDHVWVVAEGSGWYLTKGEQYPLREGSLVFAPAGEVHGMRADERLVFTSVSAG